MTENSKAIKEKPGKNPQGRRCSICSCEQVREINSLINQPISFRAISCQIFGSPSARESIRRHTENCLKLEIAALIKAKKIENAIDHYSEISDQLEFAKSLREASKEYLTHPETGAIVLMPRSDEIDVVYEDYLDTSAKGEPKKKTDSLDTLLERVKTGSINPTRTIIKHVDIRSYALDSIRVIDTVLDKFAKVQGEYAKDNEQKRPLTIDEQAIALIPKVFRSLPSLTPGMVLDAILRVVEGADERTVEAEVIRYAAGLSERTLIETSGSIM